MPYPDGFSSARYREAVEGLRKARSAAIADAAKQADQILARAVAELHRIPEAHRSRTAEMIDEAAAWMEEQRAAIRTAAETEAQDG